jgi:hypothetical protein
MLRQQTQRRERIISKQTHTGFCALSDSARAKQSPPATFRDFLGLPTRLARGAVAARPRMFSRFIRLMAR